MNDIKIYSNDRTPVKFVIDNSASFLSYETKQGWTWKGHMAALVLTDEAVRSYNSPVMQLIISVIVVEIIHGLAFITVSIHEWHIPCRLDQLVIFYPLWQGNHGSTCA